METLNIYHDMEEGMTNGNAYYMLVNLKEWYCSFSFIVSPYSWPPRHFWVVHVCISDQQCHPTRSHSTQVQQRWIKAFNELGTSFGPPSNNKLLHDSKDEFIYYTLYVICMEYLSILWISNAPLDKSTSYHISGTFQWV